QLFARIDDGDCGRASVRNPGDRAGFWRMAGRRLARDRLCSARRRHGPRQRSRDPPVARLMLRALVTLVLLLLNLVLFGTPVVLFGIVKFAVHMTAPRSRLRTRVILMLSGIAERWAGMNNRIFDWMLPTRWDIDGIPEDMSADRHYLIISNHVSWVDIFTI